MRPIETHCPDCEARPSRPCTRLFTPLEQPHEKREIAARIVADLPPCPNCGERPRLEWVYPPIPIRTLDWAVHCSEYCGEENTHAEYGRTPEDAAEGWRSYAEEEESQR